MTRTVTDEQYSKWLKQDGQSRVILAEIESYNDTEIVTHYLSTTGFVSYPSDTPPNEIYDGLINDIPSFKRGITDIESGRTTQSYGDIQIINSDGELDDWLNHGWDGRPIRLYIGDKSWARDDFRLILNGFVDDIAVRNTTMITIKARDKIDALNIPIQTNLVGGTTANKDKPKPLCFGQCYNVSPVLTDAATHAYQVHDGAIEDITAVYANGLSVAFTKNLTLGTFTTSANPFSQVITADVKGAKPSAYLTTVADIIKHIITSRSALTDDDLDLDSFAALNIAAPQLVGIYVKDRANMLSVLDELATSVGAFYGDSRTGKIKIKRLEAPSGDPVIEVTPDEIEEFSLQIKSRYIPYKSYKLGYKRNFTVMTAGLAGAVTESVAAELANEYRSIAKTNASVATKHLLAVDGALKGTLIYDSSDADAECTRLINLHNTVRKVLKVNAYAAPYQLDVGDTILIKLNKLGLDDGALATVVGFEEWPTENKITIEAWL